MGGRGSLRGDRAWGKGGVAGGLEQGSWGLGMVSKGRGPRGGPGARVGGEEGLGSGGGPSGDGMDVRTLGRTEIPPSVL